MSTGWDQLKELRVVTGQIGVLHEAQKLQLQYWPYVAAPHATHYETHCNLKDKEIHFILKVKKKKAPKDYKDRLVALDRSVKDMLGKDWLVTVKENGKEIYNGPRLQEPKDPDSTDAEFVKRGKTFESPVKIKR